MASWDGARAEHSDAQGDRDAGRALLRNRELLDELVRKYGSTVTFGCNDTICRPSERPERIYFITSGWAQRYHRLEDGSRQILRFLIPGDWSSPVAIFRASGSPNVGIRAITDVTAGAIDISRMRELIRESDQLRTILFDELCDEIRELEQRVTDLGVCIAPARIAQLLLDLYARLRARGLAQDGVFEFPVRQEDLACAVGLTPVHVNRTLTQMRRLNLLSYERGRMQLLDIERLRKVASEPTRSFIDSIARETAKQAL